MVRAWLINAWRPQGMAAAAEVLARSEVKQLQAREQQADEPAEAGKARQGKAADSRLRAGLAYGVAIGAILAAIAYRKTPGNEV